MREENERTAMICDKCQQVIAYDEGQRLVFLRFDTGEEILILDFSIKSARCTNTDATGRRCYARFSWFPSKRKKI